MTADDNGNHRGQAKHHKLIPTYIFLSISYPVPNRLPLVLQKGKTMSKYIDVEDLKNELSKAPVWTTLAVKEIIDEAPSIDIEPKRGEWKRRIVDNGFNADWVCSECGYRVKTDFVDYNFCPNCGARMKGADDEDSV